MFEKCKLNVKSYTPLINVAFAAEQSLSLPPSKHPAAASPDGTYFNVAPVSHKPFSKRKLYHEGNILTDTLRVSGPFL